MAAPALLALLCIDRRPSLSQDQNIIIDNNKQVKP
jgi:hypothetical protein